MPSDQPQETRTESQRCAAEADRKLNTLIDDALECAENLPEASLYWRIVARALEIARGPIRDLMHEGDKVQAND